VSRDLPPRLYKYFAPERWTFFSNLLVRYSQLGSFNDPFEGRPEITSLANTEDMLTHLDSVLQEEMERAYKQLPKHAQSAISYNQVLQLAQHIVKEKQTEILSNIESVGPLATKFITGKIDQILGAFCLSEVPDSLLMWAHYASSHTGFVVEFDPSHPYFHQQRSDKDDLHHIRRVRYCESRPSAPLCNMSAIELFLSKSGHWSYEREWRIVRVIQEASTIIQDTPYSIGLFKMPATCVKGVILGCRISDEIESKIRGAINANVDFGSVRITRAVADTSHFMLRFENVR